MDIIGNQNGRLSIADREKKKNRKRRNKHAAKCVGNERERANKEKSVIEAITHLQTVFSRCMRRWRGRRGLGMLCRGPQISHQSPIQSHRKISLCVSVCLWDYSLIFSCGHLRERGRQLFAQRLFDAAPPLDLGARRVQLLLRAHKIRVRRNVTRGGGRG